MHTSICIIGVGGAGGRIVGHAAPAVLGAAHVAAVNTDARELDQARAPVKLQIGTARTGGLGTGGAPSAGRLAVDDDLPTLREIVADKDFVIVVAGLGGGTGSGALPAIVRAAADGGALTVAVVTMPFAFEGAKRQGVAREALRAVQEVADAVVVMANDRLAEATGEAGLKAAFDRADDLLGRSVSTLCNLIAQPGYIKLDFAKLQHMVQHCDGTCSLAFAEASGADRAAVAATGLMCGTLLEGGKLAAAAKAVLVGIVGGPDLAVREVGELMEAIQAGLAPDCNLCMGTHVHDERRDTIQVLMLVAESWSQASAAPAVEAPRSVKQPRSGGRSRQKQSQTTLGLQLPGRGRFRNVEPTLLDGEDLDTPTYQRRGLALET
ncbi:MAG: cell division FtsZ family protein [Lentisphaerae bacterium]|nr:cell division FtsZ family protein [Lentisphaerota bacterium]